MHKRRQTLIAQPRSEQVRITGLVVGPRPVQHNPVSIVGDYLNQFSLIDKADPSTTWLISPDGQIEPVGIAYWNKQQRTIAPGSVLFVGFNPTNTQLKQLNVDIATLLNSVVSPL